ncbi:MAG TPA: hypothetical protein VN112_16360 [Ensifer sp.]|nr:hypothetical protein [Ensifer sp.]
MTGLFHEHSEAVVQAAMWFSELKEQLRTAVPVLRERFGLTSLQATQAIALAQKFRVGGIDRV